MGRKKNKPTKRITNNNAHDSFAESVGDGLNSAVGDFGSGNSHTFIRESVLESDGGVRDHNGPVVESKNGGSNTLDLINSRADMNSEMTMVDHISPSGELLDSDSSDDSDHDGGLKVRKPRRLKKLKKKRKDQVSDETSDKEHVHVETNRDFIDEDIGRTINQTASVRYDVVTASVAEEEKKEDNEPELQAPYHFKESTATKPLPEIDIIKCRRKKCKTILKFLSPNINATTPTKNIASMVMEMDEDSTEVPQSQEQKQERIVRTLILYETALETSSGPIPDIDMPTLTFPINTQSAALQILNYYSKKEKQRRSKFSVSETEPTTGSAPPLEEITDTHPQSRKNTRGAQKPKNWDPIVLALEQNLLRMELQQYKHENAQMSDDENTGRKEKQPDVSKSNDNAINNQSREIMPMPTSTYAVAIRILLTEEAYNQCSPYNLSRNVPLKRRRPPLHPGNHAKNAKKPDSKALACFLQEALGVLFEGSILDYLIAFDALNSGSSGRMKKKSSSGENDITAKMVYKALDNAHCHLFEKGGDARGDSSEINESNKSKGERKDGLELTNNVPAQMPTTVAAASSATSLNINVDLQTNHQNEQQDCTMRELETLQKNPASTGMDVLKVPGLVPRLRKYQEAAVRWMLQREKGLYEDQGWEVCWVVILEVNCSVDGITINAGPLDESTKLSYTVDKIVIPLYEYEQFKTANAIATFESCIFYNPFSGWIASNYQVAKTSTIGVCDTVKGGILAESMGLGKTVEVLACILSHPSCLSQGISGGDGKNWFGTEESTLASSSGEEDGTKDNNVASSSGEENNVFKQLRFNSNDFICFCGKGGCNKASLNWVLCRSCFEPMHGQCAGFIDEKDLIANSRAIHTSYNDNAQLRLCDARRCPTCVVTKHALVNKFIESRATLIVTPPSILAQWEREIKRHTLLTDSSNKSNPVRGLRVKVYGGVKEICNFSHKQASDGGHQRQLLHAHFLADADIVLTTFQTLMNELNHSNDNPYISTSATSGRRTSRKRKRYRVLPSPLLSIKWWRIVLDEAQRVETPTAASARMALKLVSHHKWCVSGTPVGKGKMDDLYGLLLFLNFKPFCERDWFRTCVKAGYGDITKRIAHMLQSTLWRSTKSNNTVRKQMGIPEQIEKKTRLSFSSIERHFYQRQLEETMLAADAIISTKKGNGKKRKAKDVDMLSHHLHRLRAACCHPQVGSSGIGKLKKQSNISSTSVATGVLSMSQILDRLIDDAKIKAEEAQRLYTLNTNAIACLYKLKAESGVRGGTLIDSEDEISLLQKSSKAYMDAIDIADNNSTPSSIVGEAVVTGCNGFQTPGEVIRDGAANLTWVVQMHDDGDELEHPEVWTRFDFNGATKKITSIAVRPFWQENDTRPHCSTLRPRECILQVSNAAIGGMFVDALSFTLPGASPRNQDGYDWQHFHGFRPHKSKSWRVLVKNYHHGDDQNNIQTTKFYIGIQVQLLEPDIVPDSLQRLHILHNGALTLSTIQNKAKEESTPIDAEGGNITIDELETKITKMNEEKDNLESHYIEAARVLQMTSQVRLDEITTKRKKLQRELYGEVRPGKLKKESWWNDLIAWCNLYPSRSIQDSFVEYVEESLFELYNDPSQPFNRRTFPVTNSLDGLNIALNMRLQENTFFLALSSSCTDDNVFLCINSITNLSDHPSDRAIFENSHCHKCRADWDQKGPMCDCCKLEEQLLEHQQNVNETEINCILRAMATWLKQNEGRHRTKHQSSTLNLRNLSKTAEKYFEIQSLVRKELDCAKSKWRTHLDLLSDIDELNQCKRTMRLCYEDENLYGLTPHEQAFIVQPRNIPALIMDHTAKQAMAEGNLRRSKELLRFLKNQNLERIQSLKSTMANDEDEYSNTCCICLCPFDSSGRAVLRCGHVFHYSPCLERLLARGGSQTITCPMRCAVRTKREDILIASDIRKDDGSKAQRKIEGSWGTKVTRLISDILEVIELGEKSIVFSQWDDMLHIMETAMRANSIQYVRPKSIKSFGDSMRFFRTPKCQVLLMHVKHGAEGLTLVEANHIFMIEPLLNHSMDSQAINRIHRIGQTSKTFIHRYIIEDTIEVKIDRLRVDRQSHDGEEEDATFYGKGGKKNAGIKAGGVDGGFNENELMELFK